MKRLASILIMVIVSGGAQAASAEPEQIFCKTKGVAYGVGAKIVSGQESWDSYSGSRKNVFTYSIDLVEGIVRQGYSGGRPARRSLAQVIDNAEYRFNISKFDKKQFNVEANGWKYDLRLFWFLKTASGVEPVAMPSSGSMYISIPFSGEGIFTKMSANLFETGWCQVTKRTAGKND